LEKDPTRRHFPRAATLHQQYPLQGKHYSVPKVPCIAMDTANMAVTLEGLPPLELLEQQWRDLESRAKGTFFNSWSWIGAWLKTYAIEATTYRQAKLLVGRRSEVVVALGVVCRLRRPRFPGTKRMVLLHQTGRADDAAAFIEYNGFLVDRSLGLGAEAALLDFIDRDAVFTEGDWSWDEFEVPGALPTTMTALQRGGHTYRLHKESICPWVDLSVLQPGPDGYLASLSANTRAQIRRATRLFTEAGAPALTVARTRAEVDGFIAEMRVLHEETWQRRGKNQGAFSFPVFAEFLDAMFDIALPIGQIEVLRVSVSARTIGILLNFIYDGQVYAYQSGLAYGADNRLKPGLVTHAMAVVHYRDRGLAGYHFMAGDGRYKSSLGTNTETLAWPVLVRDDTRTRLEYILRNLKGLLGRTVRKETAMSPRSEHV
jgi:hypothetical protein